MRTRREQGLSLIELQVASVIAVLVGLAIFGLLRSGFALSQRGAEAVGAGEASVALEAIARSLRESGRDPNVVRIWSNDTGPNRHTTIAILSARQPDGSYAATEEGQPAWTRWVAFVHDPRRRELRRWDLAEIDEMSWPPPGGSQTVARHVTAFTVDRLEDRITVAIRIERRGRALALRTEVWPRNR